MTDTNGLNRRDFLRGVTLTSVGLAMAAEEIILTEQSAGAQGDAKAAAPVNCAVIGLGTQGKEILASLAKLGNGPVVALCDSYASPPFLKRSTDIAPSATVVQDYRKVLEMANVQAVFVATPTHLHKQIVLDALAAGKHVYCEAPLAVDLAEAKAIAAAGAAAKTVFQPGLQFRCNKMHNHAVSFSGGMATKIGGQGQWNKKGSWKRDVGNPERTAALNWRLGKATSLGLPGEVGIHSLDIASWYLKALPISVTGTGATMFYGGDGMEVPDTVECILEYPGNVRFTYSATLASSFAGSYELFYGTDCSILVRDQRAWMFKETDSPLLGWEVYARKEKVGDDTGIVLVADATQIMARGEEPGKVGADISKTALYQAVDAFLGRVRGDKKDPKRVANGALEGYQATVIAAKAHEAVMTGSKITFTKEMFDL
jgi:predicted dehydrogenase